MLYLIHFAKPFHHARHYLGYTEDLDRRIRDHTCGHGSPLIRAVTDAGIGWQVAVTMPGDRTAERKIKNRHNGPRLCPICRLGLEVKNADN